MLFHKSKLIVCYFVVSLVINHVLIDQAFAEKTTDKTLLLILHVDENSIQLTNAVLKAFPYRKNNTESINNGYHYELLLNNQVVHEGDFYDPLNRMDGTRVLEDTIMLKTPYFNNTESLLFRYRKMDNGNILNSGEFNIDFVAAVK